MIHSKGNQMIFLNLLKIMNPSKVTFPIPQFSSLLLGTCEEIKKENTSLKAEIEEKNNAIKSYELKVEALNTQISENIREKQEVDEKLEEARGIIAERDAAIVERDDTIQDLTQKYEKSQEDQEELSDTLKQLVFSPTSFTTSHFQIGE